MLRQNGLGSRPPEDDRELTEAQARWVREQIQLAEHRKWLCRMARQVGITVSAIVGTLGASLGAVLAFKEILKWIFGGGK